MSRLSCLIKCPYCIGSSELQKYKSCSLLSYKFPSPETNVPQNNKKQMLTVCIYSLRVVCTKLGYIMRHIYSHIF